jgi:hypothetical protein
LEQNIMGWLQRIFGMEKPEGAQVNPEPAPAPQETPSEMATPVEAIPPERLGLHGEYDQSGLAKRVTLAFDEDPELTDVEGLWVAQLTGLVVLQGKVPNQEILDRMVMVASKVNGATGVKTDEVTVG